MNNTSEENCSTAVAFILSLPLIQEGQLSVSGCLVKECALVLVNCFASVQKMCVNSP